MSRVPHKARQIALQLGSGDDGGLVGIDDDVGLHVHVEHLTAFSAPVLGLEGLAREHTLHHDARVALAHAHQVEAVAGLGMFPVPHAPVEVLLDAVFHALLVVVHVDRRYRGIPHQYYRIHSL